MFETLVRLIAGLVSTLCGVLAMIVLFIVGGRIQAEVTAASPSVLVVGLLSLVFAALLSLVVLFAFSAYSGHSGPARPKLWLGCIAAGGVGAVAFLLLKLV